jgi:hypothetical protein
MIVLLHLIAHPSCNEAPVNAIYADQAFSIGGITLTRRREDAFVTTNLRSAALVFGNSDHNKAMVPVTKAVAALVPVSDKGLPSGPRLITSSPGALIPRFPISVEKLEP